ncbi:hypothetical protein ASPCAL13320 [Aspergillus calidoustus]|uniref:Uncharacterized protein n=1 Tax=Aspergillus calidoustus TaxID=454130 RepID=A0A0U5H7W9_ASPCI|nr:hypothetical protein ASPCAL13320 [Aspergillus calidoustus]
MAAPPGATGVPAPPPPPPAGIYQFVDPLNPWRHFADLMLDTLSEREIADVLKQHPTFAGYVVVVYGRRRWSNDGWLCLRNTQETETWHRERDREDQLKLQLWELAEQRRPLLGTAAAAPFTQKLLWVQIELENIKRQFLLRTLRGVVANQMAYSGLADLAQPTPLQLQYIAWRAYILQDLAARIRDCDGELRDLFLRLVATGPNPARPNRPVRLTARNLPGFYPSVRATTNLRRYPCLIDKLVERDCVDALRFLRWLGVFTPVSYTRQGHTMLHEALARERRLATRYLIQSYMPIEIWRRPYGTLCLQQNQATPSDLEYLVQHERFAEFKRIWQRIYPVFATLPPAQQPLGVEIFRTGNLHDILATWANRAFAEELAAPPLNLDLGAIVPWAHNHRIAIQGGTVWHLAVLNDNTDFLDFVWRVPANKATIELDNQTGPPYRTPLELAIQHDQRDQAARLIQYGATVTRTHIEDINKGLPTTQDRLWQTLLHSTSTDLRVGAGTIEGGWLHDIVNGLNDHITRINQDPDLARAQKTKEKRLYVGRAKSLIQKITAGTLYSMPVDRNMQDAAGLTARALAEQFALSMTVINVL